MDGVAIRFLKDQRFEQQTSHIQYHNLIHRALRPVGEYKTAWSVALEESRYCFLLFC